MTRLSCLIVASACLMRPQPVAAQPPGGTTWPLVTAAWLSQHLADPGTVVLHVGERGEYDAGHIPGARFISLAVISRPHGEGLALELPPVERLRETFESLGVTDAGRVVLYFGKDWVSPLTRVFFTLDYLGVGDRTFVLDGGLPVWRAEGHPVTTEVPGPTRGAFTPRLRAEVVADLAWMRANLDAPGISLIDARAPEFYTGEDDGNGRYPRPGHIKGARSLPFTQLVDDASRFKGRDGLARLLEQAGVVRGATVVSYCHIGQQATVIYFTARLLGYEAKLYDGSFEEWSPRTDLPVERSSGPPR